VLALRKTPDGLTIEGVKVCVGRVDSESDHRVAMSLAVAAQIAVGPPCCREAKRRRWSYPGFWNDLARLQAVIRTCAQAGRGEGG